MDRRKVTTNQISFNLAAVSFALAVISQAMSFALDASTTMIAITGVSLVLAFSLLVICPAVFGPYLFRGRGWKHSKTFLLSRDWSALYGILELVIIIGGAIAFEDIAYSDQTVGAILAISAICAIVASALCKPPPRTENDLDKAIEETLKKNFADPIDALIGATAESGEKKSDEKEIIKKDVVAKIRCPYCRGVYDETLDKCPTCGAAR